MSYQIEVIITNGRKVREVFASKNIELINIIDEYDLNEYDFFLESHFDLSTKELSSKKLMENIVNGTTENYYTNLLLDKEKEKFGNSTLGAVYGYLERDYLLILWKIY